MWLKPNIVLTFIPVGRGFLILPPRRKETKVGATRRGLAVSGELFRGIFVLGWSLLDSESGSGFVSPAEEETKTQPTR